MDSPIDKLHLGLQRLEQSVDTPDLLGPALVSLHGALEDHIRSWLAKNDRVPGEQRAAVQDPRQTSWKELLDLMERYGDLSKQARHRIQYANALRQEVAQGGRYRGTRRDVERYAGLVRSIIGIDDPSNEIAGRVEQVAMPSRLAAPKPRWLYAMWSGRDNPVVLWRTLLATTLAVLLVGLGYNVGLVAITWPMPYKLVGGFALLLAAVALIWAARSVLAIILRLGVKRLVADLVLLYIGALVLVGLRMPSDEQGLNHWLHSATTVGRWVAEGARDIGRELVEIPGTVRNAAVAPPVEVRLPDFSWIAAAPRLPYDEPLKTTELETTTASPSAIATARPAPTAESAGTLQVGNVVRVVGTAGAQLRARSAPTVEATVVTRFAPDSIVEIVGGPQVADGRVWWQVRGAQGEGWCAADFLMLDGVTR